MKKSLVALAALAATSAFAQFSIDGVYDVGYQQIDYKGNKVTGVNGNGSSTSQLNLRGTEDLGGGLKASFRVETDWNSVSNGANMGGMTGTATSPSGNLSSFGNGELRAGISGPFGTINAGAVNMNGLTTFVTGQPFGTAIGGGYGSVTRVNTTGNAVRADNSVMYVSPAFSGLTLTLYKAMAQTKAAATTFSNALGYYDHAGSQEVGLNYASGPIAASFSQLKQNKTGIGTNATTTPYDNAETTLTSIGANYTMGALKLFLLNQTNKNDATNRINMAFTSMSATYTMGNTVLMAQSGTFDNKAAYGSANTNGATVVDKSNLLGLGVDYNLSKTTALYVRHESIKDKANILGGYYSAAASVFDTASGSVGETRKRTAVGLRMGF